ncbi:hypothetical protein [Dyadobacter diqingensis]|uniref:hypothetical protein n=1 Tax=Dyadobacter diqingensis TaxID=2938121 RepID=UPI0020C18D1D|nr:hypothetical protein [Dyadobacter diqingensis]
MAKIIRQVNIKRQESDQEPIAVGEEVPPAALQFSDPAQFIADWLIGTSGAKPWTSLRDNPLFQSPYNQATSDITVWLTEIIKSFFTYEHIEMIEKGIVTKNVIQEQKLNEVQNQLTRVTLDKNDLIERFRRIQDDFAQRDAELIRVNRMLKGSVSLSEILPYWFGKDDDVSFSLRQILQENLHNPDDELVRFAIIVSKSWSNLQNLFADLPEGDEDKLNLVYPFLTRFLQEISGIEISQRRIVLDVLAKACTVQFGNYIFISPEETLRVDPAIHQATGAGSESIKEGRSFVVIRRDTRQTARFAEIDVV